MKDADYRKKTAEVAEAKRIAQAQVEQVQAERTHYANHLDVVLGSLQAQLVGDQAELAKLAKTDPAQWVAANAEFQERYAAYQQAVAERQQLANRMTAEQEKANEDWRKGEAAALQEKLPEWRDEKIKKAETESIGKYLLDQGYAVEELDELFDHRALLVARDAAKWRAHQANLKSAKDKQVKPEPSKPIKSGAAKDPTQTQQSYQDALRRMKNAGDDDAAMALLRAKRQ